MRKRADSNFSWVCYSALWHSMTSRAKIQVSWSVSLYPSFLALGSCLFGGSWPNVGWNWVFGLILFRWNCYNSVYSDAPALVFLPNSTIFSLIWNTEALSMPSNPCAHQNVYYGALSMTSLFTNKYQIPLRFFLLILGTLKNIYLFKLKKTYANVLVQMDTLFNKKVPPRHVKPADLVFPIRLFTQRQGAV